MFLFVSEREGVGRLMDQRFIHFGLADPAPNAVDIYPASVTVSRRDIRLAQVGTYPLPLGLY